MMSANERWELIKKFDTKAMKWQVHFNYAGTQMEVWLGMARHDLNVGDGRVVAARRIRLATCSIEGSIEGALVALYEWAVNYRTSCLRAPSSS